MAPILNTLPEDVLSLISAVERRCNYLTESELPKLRQCIGPLSLQQTLAEELRVDTAAVTRQVEALEIMVDDLQGEKKRRELRRIVDDFNKKLASLRQETRVALLTSKRNIDARSKSNKEDLLAFVSVLKDKQDSSEKSTDDALMKASSDVTDALRRTVSLMQAELERSVLTTQMLVSSTATLRSTSLQHDALNSVMSTSKQLITALEKSDWLDRILIISGFVFFLLVVLFILKQRIIDRGLRIAFWWTRFLPDFSSDEELLQSSVGEPSSLSATAVSVVASLISLAASSSTATTEAVLSSITPISKMPDPSSTLADKSEIEGAQNSALEPIHQTPSSLPEHIEL
ncbi:Sec20-domain-containing protein [Phlegmacium glaucopus]|nr:Sec20-domain-containing protein [Phlegmacium glaucopus]